MAKSEQPFSSEPSESEQRCNSFVRDLSDNFHLEYHTMDLEVVNLKDFLQRHNIPDTIKVLAKNYLGQSDNTSSLESMGIAVDQMSSFVSMTFVSISPKKGIKHPISFIEQSISYVDRLAQWHGGTRLDTDKELNIAEDPSRVINLGYEFLSERFKKEQNHNS